ncbi:MAG: sugar phosphate nucleotidyltransferase [Patescibacteria group bacterium]
MKGVILAGGSGSRLHPLTKVTNKHLLPVYNKPMIYYPLYTLINAGLKDILIVSGPGHAGHFLNLLGSGKEFGVHLTYEIQEEAGGIAQALGLASDFADEGNIAVILGDNIFEDNFVQEIKGFADRGAMVFLKEVSDPERFGVATVEQDKIVKIMEKPKEPETNYAVTGLYLYDHEVFNAIKTLKPSARGELEITDVNNYYISRDLMKYSLVKGAWTDAGTFDSLLRANNQVAKNKNY